MKRLFTLLSLLAFFGCQEQNCLAPEPKMFDILYYNQDKVNLMNEVQLAANGKGELVNQELSIYYYKDGIKMLIDFWHSPDTDTFNIFNSTIYPDNLIQITGDGSQEFYFELGGEIDTLLFNVNREQHPECEGYVYDVLKVTFNGLPVEVVRFPATSWRYYYLESNKH